MITFIKAQATFIAGSVVDFGMTYFLVTLGLPYLAGNLAGNVLGSIAQFLLCRGWVFHAEAGETGAQVLRFALIYVGNLALSALGVYCLTHFLEMHYMLSKLITSVTLGVTYNYFLQKEFVFQMKRPL
jgi:putative flippase GtrA